MLQLSRYSSLRRLECGHFVTAAAAPSTHRTPRTSSATARVAPTIVSPMPLLASGVKNGIGWRSSSMSRSLPRMKLMQLHEQEFRCLHCRSPLNNYPFSRVINGKTLMWCGATCFGLYERELRHRASIASGLAPGSYSAGSLNAGQTDTQATQKTRAAFTLAAAFASGVVLAIGALA
jgi:hypothetical protein